MKKMISVKGLILTGALMIATPSYALFTNGGFEDGTTTGWTIGYGSVASSSTHSPDWTTIQTGQPTPVVIDNTYNDGSGINIDPYTGTRMVKINDIGGGYHATKLSQTDTITDLTETLYVNWGAALTNPSGHSSDDQPFFNIDILRNGVSLDNFFADGINASTPGSGWTNINTSYNLWYKTGQYQYDLSSFSIGDSITIEMFVTDCGAGGHGGYAFLDGVGTVYVAPPSGSGAGGSEVPEPATMLLFGTGLAGIAGARRRKKKK